MFTKKGYARRPALIFILIYSIAFVLFYGGYLMYSEWEIGGVALEVYKYIFAFYTEAAEFTAPMLLGFAMTALAEAKGLKYTLLRSGIHTLPYAVYVLLSEYIDTTISGGDFTYSLLRGAIYAAIGAIFFYLQAVVVLFLVRFLIKKLKGDGAAAGALDTSSSLVKALFIACLIKFAIMLGLEIYTSIDYLIAFAGYYTVPEILYMIFRFIFIFAELFGCHILGYSIKAGLKEIYASEPLDENEAQTPVV